MQSSKISDKYILELGEARLLYRTYESTKQKVLTPVRIKWLEKTYGNGAAERIKNLMIKLSTGELE